MGRQPTAGYDIRITDVRDTGQSTSVYVQEVHPAPGTPVAQVLTRPYPIVVVPTVMHPVYFVPVEATPTPPIAIQDGFLGVQRNATQPQTLVFRDQLAWERFWTQTFGEKAATPAVDFARNMAAAVLPGTRPSGGYSVLITSGIGSMTGWPLIIACVPRSRARRTTAVPVTYRPLPASSDIPAC